MDWEWNWETTAHPETFGANPVFDWLRVACVIASLVMMWATLRVIIEQARRPHPFPLHQVLRFVSLLLAAVSLSLTEITVVGTPATPRLLVNLVCLITGAIGVAAVRHQQRHTPFYDSKGSYRDD